MKTALVVPSNRQNSIRQFLNAWNEAEVFWDQIIVVEDNPEKTFDIAVDLHVSWKEIEEDLKDDAWIISKRDSAIRSYGFLLAYQQGAEVIYTLDDDCLPVSSTFVEDHIRNLTDTPKWVSSIPGYRTRGLPYFNLGKSNRVVMSVGLWSGVPDYDSVQVLAKTPPPPSLPETRVMPVGQYFPICGMNFCFKREVAPLTYFPLMGEGYKYRRFDDIWFGVICKKICDHLGLLITCGEPYVHHSKASDPMVNLVKEAPGIARHETLWEVIDGVSLSERTPIDCVYEMSEQLSNVEDEYISTLGSALDRWADQFDRE